MKPLTFDEVYNQSSPTNCTVYCGGIGGNLAGELTEEILQKKFQPFGTIQEIRVFKDKGYAFVRFSTKEAATHAIVAIHNSEINQQTVKCSWGKVRHCQMFIYVEKIVSTVCIYRNRVILIMFQLRSLPVKL